MPGADNTYTRLATSSQFYVERASLTASPSSVNAGGTLTVDWGSVHPANAGDWVGLYAPNAPNSPPITYGNTAG